MELPTLTNGKIISRYKRFLADVELSSGEVVTVHCPNTGAMTSCWEPGAAVQLSASTNPKRKLNWTLERVDMGQGWIGVNTNRVNKFVGDFIVNGEIEALSGYSGLKAEPVYLAEGFDKSRFDFLLTAKGRRDCYVEVKNATLLKDGIIQFPDAVTTRGSKHLSLLVHAVHQGHRSVMLFAVSRPEGGIFKVAKEIDPAYYQSLLDARDKGVEVMTVRVFHTKTGVEARESLLIDLH